MCQKARTLISPFSHPRNPHRHRFMEKDFDFDESPEDRLSSLRIFHNDERSGFVEFDIEPLTSVRTPSMIKRDPHQPRSPSSRRLPRSTSINALSPSNSVSYSKTVVRPQNDGIPTAFSNTSISTDVQPPTGLSALRSFSLQNANSFQSMECDEPSPTARHSPSRHGLPTTSIHTRPGALRDVISAPMSPINNDAGNRGFGVASSNGSTDNGVTAMLLASGKGSKSGAQQADRHKIQKMDIPLYNSAMGSEGYSTDDNSDDYDDSVYDSDSNSYDDKGGREYDMHDNNSYRFDEFQENNHFPENPGIPKHVHIPVQESQRPPPPPPRARPKPMIDSVAVSTTSVFTTASSVLHLPANTLAYAPPHPITSSPTHTCNGIAPPLTSPAPPAASMAVSGPDGAHQLSPPILTAPTSTTRSAGTPCPPPPAPSVSANTLPHALAVVPLPPAWAGPGTHPHIDPRTLAPATVPAAGSADSVTQWHWQRRPPPQQPQQPRRGSAPTVVLPPLPSPPVQPPPAPSLPIASCTPPSSARGPSSPRSGPRASSALPAPPLTIPQYPLPPPPQVPPEPPATYPHTQPHTHMRPHMQPQSQVFSGQAQPQAVHLSAPPLPPRRPSYARNTPIHANSTPAATNTFSATTAHPLAAVNAQASAAAATPSLLTPSLSRPSFPLPHSYHSPAPAPAPTPAPTPAPAPALVPTAASVPAPASTAVTASQAPVRNPNATNIPLSRPRTQSFDHGAKTSWEKDIQIRNIANLRKKPLQISSTTSENSPYFSQSPFSEPQLDKNVPLTTSHLTITTAGSPTTSPASTTLSLPLPQTHNNSNTIPVTQPSSPPPSPPRSTTTTTIRTRDGQRRAIVSVPGPEPLNGYAAAPRTRAHAWDEDDEDVVVETLKLSGDGRGDGRVTGNDTNSPGNTASRIQPENSETRGPESVDWENLYGIPRELVEYEARRYREAEKAAVLQHDRMLAVGWMQARPGSGGLGAGGIGSAGIGAGPGISPGVGLGVGAGGATVASTRRSSRSGRDGASRGYTDGRDHDSGSDGDVVSSARTRRSSRGVPATQRSSATSRGSSIRGSEGGRGQDTGRGRGGGRAGTAVGKEGDIAPRVPPAAPVLKRATTAPLLATAPAPEPASTKASATVPSTATAAPLAVLSSVSDAAPAPVTATVSTTAATIATASLPPVVSATPAYSPRAALTGAGLPARPSLPASMPASIPASIPSSAALSAPSAFIASVPISHSSSSSAAHALAPPAVPIHGPAPPPLPSQATLELATTQAGPTHGTPVHAAWPLPPTPPTAPPIAPLATVPAASTAAAHLPQSYAASVSVASAPLSTSSAASVAVSSLGNEQTMNSGGPSGWMVFKPAAGTSSAAIPTHTATTAAATGSSAGLSTNAAAAAGIASSVASGVSSVVGGVVGGGAGAHVPVPPLSTLSSSIDTYVPITSTNMVLTPQQYQQYLQQQQQQRPQSTPALPLHHQLVQSAGPPQQFVNPGSVQQQFVHPTGIPGVTNNPKEPISIASTQGSFFGNSGHPENPIYQNSGRRNSGPIGVISALIGPGGDLSVKPPRRIPDIPRRASLAQIPDTNSGKPLRLPLHDPFAGGGKGVIRAEREVAQGEDEEEEAAQLSRWRAKVEGWKKAKEEKEREEREREEREKIRAREKQVEKERGRGKEGRRESVPGKDKRAEEEEGGRGSDNREAEERRKQKLESGKSQRETKTQHRRMCKAPKGADGAAGAEGRGRDASEGGEEAGEGAAQTNASGDAGNSVSASTRTSTSNSTSVSMGIGTNAVADTATHAAPRATAHSEQYPLYAWGDSGDVGRAYDSEDRRERPRTEAEREAAREDELRRYMLEYQRIQLAHVGAQGTVTGLPENDDREKMVREILDIPKQKLPEEISEMIEKKRLAEEDRRRQERASFFNRLFGKPKTPVRKFRKPRRRLRDSDDDESSEGSPPPYRRVVEEKLARAHANNNNKLDDNNNQGNNSNSNVVGSDVPRTSDSNSNAITAANNNNNSTSTSTSLPSPTAATGSATPGTPALSSGTGPLSSVRRALNSVRRSLDSGRSARSRATPNALCAGEVEVSLDGIDVAGDAAYEHMEVELEVGKCGECGRARDECACVCECGDDNCETNQEIAREKELAIRKKEKIREMYLKSEKPHIPSSESFPKMPNSFSATKSGNPPPLPPRNIPSAPRPEDDVVPNISTTQRQDDYTATSTTQRRGSFMATLWKGIEYGIGASLGRVAMQLAMPGVGAGDEDADDHAVEGDGASPKCKETAGDKEGRRAGGGAGAQPALGADAQPVSGAGGVHGGETGAGGRERGAADERSNTGEAGGKTTQKDGKEKEEKNGDGQGKYEEAGEEDDVYMEVMAGRQHNTRLYIQNSSAAKESGGKNNGNAGKTNSDGKKSSGNESGNSKGSGDSGANSGNTEPTLTISELCADVHTNIYMQSSQEYRQCFYDIYCRDVTCNRCGVPSDETDRNGMVRRWTFGVVLGCEEEEELAAVEAPALTFGSRRRASESGASNTASSSSAVAAPPRVRVRLQVMHLCGGDVVVLETRDGRGAMPLFTHWNKGYKDVRMLPAEIQAHIASGYGKLSRAMARVGRNLDQEINEALGISPQVTKTPETKQSSPKQPTPQQVPPENSENMNLGKKKSGGRKWWSIWTFGEDDSHIPPDNALASDGVDGGDVDVAGAGVSSAGGGGSREREGGATATTISPEDHDKTSHATHPTGTGLMGFFGKMWGYRTPVTENVVIDSFTSLHLSPPILLATNANATTANTTTTATGPGHSPDADASLHTQHAQHMVLSPPTALSTLRSEHTALHSGNTPLGGRPGTTPRTVDASQRRVGAAQTDPLLHTHVTTSAHTSTGMGLGAGVAASAAAADALKYTAMHAHGNLLSSRHSQASNTATRAATGMGADTSAHTDNMHGDHRSGIAAHLGRSGAVAVGGIPQSVPPSAVSTPTQHTHYATMSTSLTYSTHPHIAAPTTSTSTSTASSTSSAFASAFASASAPVSRPIKREHGFRPELGTGLGPGSGTDAGPGTDSRLCEGDHSPEACSGKIICEKGDGNCLFRAISRAVYGSPSSHMAVRDMTAQWLWILRSLYSEFIVEDIDAYVKKIERGGWGGEVELRLLADIYNCKIVVYQEMKPERKMNVFSQFLESAPPPKNHPDYIEYIRTFGFPEGEEPPCGHIRCRRHATCVHGRCVQARVVAVYEPSPAVTTLLNDPDNQLFLCRELRAAAEAQLQQAMESEGRRAPKYPTNTQLWTAIGNPLSGLSEIRKNSEIPDLSISLYTWLTTRGEIHLLYGDKHYDSLLCSGRVVCEDDTLSGMGVRVVDGRGVACLEAGVYERVAENIAAMLAKANEEEEKPERSADTVTMVDKEEREENVSEEDSAPISGVGEAAVAVAVSTRAAVNTDNGAGAAHE